MTIELSPYRRVPSIPFLKEASAHKHYLVFDTETKLIKRKDGLVEHKPFLICYQHLCLHSDGTFDKGKIMHTDSVPEFYEIVDTYAKSYYELNLIAHNVSYDISAVDIFTMLDMYGYKCAIYNPHKGAYFCRFSRKEANINIVDNLNFFSGSLANLGKELGLSKLEMPKTQKLTDEFLTYCKRDVEILTLGLCELSRICGKYNEGALAITRAKLIFRIYQKNFMNNRILLHNDKEVLGLEYSAYYGGRTEAFFQGTARRQDYFYVDVNSLYPSVMRGRKFSTRLRYKFGSADLDKVRRAMKSMNVCAKVDIDTSMPIYPLKTATKVIFPVGQFTTFLAQPELEFALEHGHVSKIHSGAAYHRTEIFTDFIDHFYEMKQRYTKEHKPIFTYFAKLCLNSLYGKFGQRIPALKPTGTKSESRYGIVYCYDLTNNTKYRKKIINHNEYIESERQVSTYSVPIIVSEITSAARMRLWDLLSLAGLEHVYYTDTDSLIVDSAGYANLSNELDPLALGKLKLESESNRLTINGLKDYTFGKKTTLKSVPRKHKVVGQNMYEFEYFATTTDVLSQEKSKFMFTETRRKEMKRQISKGVKDRSGRVSPWCIHLLGK